MLFMQGFLENTPRELAIAAAVAFGSYLLIAGVVALARRQLARAAETAWQYDDLLLDLTRRTHLLLMMPVALYVGARSLVLPYDLGSMLTTFARLSLIAQSALWAVGVVDFFLERYRRRRVETDPAAITTIRAFRFASFMGLWTIAVLVALDNLGIDITALVTGLGIGGVAVALAVQNILSDLFASLSIVLDKPFVVGDFIAVAGDLGSIERIGLKTTRLRSLSGEQLIFSNNDLLKNRIRNYKRMNERRVLFRFGVVYQTPAETLERITQIVRTILESLPEVRFDRVHFAAFGDSSYDFEVVYYVLSPDYNVYMDRQQAINLAMVRAFAPEGIEFAYPTRTLFVQKNAEDDTTLH